MLKLGRCFVIKCNFITLVFNKEKIKVMNLEVRKYYFIKEFFNIEDERIIEVLERVLRHEKEQQEIPGANKEKFDIRLTRYRAKPNLLIWDDK